MDQPFVLVSFAGRRRLVRVTDIQEIVALMAVTEVDGRRGMCRGVVNLRGAILPVFDLSGPRAPLSPSRFIVMSRVGGRVVGLIVDEVVDVLSLPADDLSLLPVGGGTSTLVALHDGELISVLDPADAVGHEG